VLFQRPKFNNAKFTVQLVDANIEDDGNYTCIVSNEHGSISHTTILDVVRKLHTVLAFISLFNFSINSMRLRCCPIIQLGKTANIMFHLQNLLS
jgi:hypothetical protein